MSVTEHDDAPWRLSACETLAMLRSGRLGALELIRSVAEHAERLQSALHAFTAGSFAHFDQALAQAEEADRRYRHGNTRALEGLPVAVKEDTDVEGQATTHGSQLFGAHRATLDAPLVERLRVAGAIVLGRTTASEFSCAAVTHSPANGITRNPWNPALSPGGSSGGAGAALASGAALLATGTDMAGSLRIPAAACGVVGFKPPHGRIPADPGRAQDPLFHVGAMARTVADCRLLHNVLVGSHPRDPASLRPTRRISDRITASVRGWRIAVSPGLGFSPVDPLIVNNLNHTATRLADLGATVEFVDPAWDSELLRTADILIAWLHGPRIRRHLPEHRRRMAPYTRAFAERARRLTHEQRLAALTHFGAASAAFERIMSRCRLFVCPTLAVPAVPADHDPVRGTLAAAGHALDPALGWTLAWPFNLLAAHPVLAVPSGFTADGMPLGIQLVGRRHADTDVFRAALTLESARGSAAFQFPATLSDNRRTP